jgi:hypothetical protein
MNEEKKRVYDPATDPTRRFGGDQPCDECGCMECDDGAKLGCSTCSEELAWQQLNEEKKVPEDIERFCFYDEQNETFFRDYIETPEDRNNAQMIEAVEEVFGLKLDRDLVMQATACFDFFESAMPDNWAISDPMTAHERLLYWAIVQACFNGCNPVAFLESSAVRLRREMPEHVFPTPICEQETDIQKRIMDGTASISELEAVSGRGGGKSTR